jgi:heat induced stress protein YflT
MTAVFAQLGAGAERPHDQWVRVKADKVLSVPFQQEKSPMNDRIVSAVFDSEDEARNALNELRSAGIDENSISIIGRHGEQSSSDNIAASDSVNDRDGDGVNGSGAAKGALGGAVVGGLLGVAALAIPGVGPLAAAGAIASGAIPGAAALGAGAGAVAGGLSGLLTDHGVSDEDARYYEDRLNQGGIFLSVDGDKSGVDVEQAREILFRNGGHNASRQRMSEPATTEM